jgi:hypothetical protein
LDHDPVLSAFLSATQAVVFFGGPHRGMITKDIENYLADQFPGHIARQKIVAELRQDDESTKRELQDFIDLVGPFFIISICERKPSRTLVPQESEGQVRKWDRVGQEYVPVVENSAVLNLPSRFEIRIPIDSDHSNMAKFDHKDLTYQALLGYLKEIEQISSPAAYPWTNLLNSGRRRLPSHDKVEEAESDIINQKALINVAIKIVRSYRTSVLRVLDQNVADQASLLLSIEVALLEARNYLSLLQCSSQGGKTVARAIVMEYCETMNNLIVLLDVLSTHTANFTSYPRQPHLPRQQLPQILQRLERLKQQASRILSYEISQLYHSLGSASALQNEASKKISTLANMSITQFDLDNLSHLDPQWVPYTDLYFATGATSETDREEKNWLERLVATFTQFNAQNLKLQPRRFGAFDYENQLRKVMVEFRPYLPKLWETRPTEYDRQKWQVIKLGRMLRAATASDAAASFPCVPLLFLSECRTSSPPTFVLIYAAENLYSLDEAVRFSPPPSPQQRLRLALRLARSIAALHLAGIVHGVINPENIYLRYDPGLHARSDPFNISIDEAMAMLAGFDIARDFAGRSSKLDVEDTDLRVYLHPERMGWGGEKEMQHPRYDVFSLGLVMIEIGLWKRFKMLQKYQNADTDEERKEFSMQLRGHFKGNAIDGYMDERYRAIVSYCLGRRADPIIQEDDLEIGLHSASVLPLGIPNAVRVVQALTKILGESESS